MRVAVDAGGPFGCRVIDDLVIGDGQRELGRGIGGAGVDDASGDFPVRIRFLAGGQSVLGFVCAGHDHLVLELAFDGGDGRRVIAVGVLFEGDGRSRHGGRVFGVLGGLSFTAAVVPVCGVFVGGGRHDSGPRHAEGQCRYGGDGARVAQTAAVTFGHFRGFSLPEFSQTVLTVTSGFVINRFFIESNRFVFSRGRHRTHTVS